MTAPRIVIDTNVFISALLSQRGASNKLVMLADSGLFQLNLSVPLIVEYEDAAQRILDRTILEDDDLHNILNYLCNVSNCQEIFFLWRPFLRDPKDDMVLELAVAASCTTIVSFNAKDFVGVTQFGLEVVTPQTFLRQIGQGT